MKLTSKDKIINQSISEKIEKARMLEQQDKHYQAIQAYHKVLFLKEDPQYMYELAEIYEKILDYSSASLFYRRVHQLNNSSLAYQKIKYFAKIKGLQLLEIGSVKNILQDTQFQLFKKRYTTFHKRLYKKVAQKPLYGEYLHSALAYLQVNHRQLALSEIDNCIIIEEKDVDLIIFRAMIYWSVLENQKGYKQFWNAYSLDKSNPEVVLFLQMIQPEIEGLYKQAKYDLIDRKVQKCRLKVKKGLQIHPYHTQLLILSAYLHRNKEQYEKALSDLQLANKHLEDHSLEGELRNQISLTYNQMGIFLYKQNKFNEAITLFTQGLTFNAKDWGIITNRGDCYRALNDFVKALEDYVKAFQIEKKNQQLNFRISSIYSLRGVALFNSKNYELALKEFQQAINYSPRCPQFYLSKAKCLLQIGRKQQSVQSLQKCLQLDDKQLQASQLLSQLKQGQERRGKNNRKIIFLSKQK